MLTVGNDIISDCKLLWVVSVHVKLSRLLGSGRVLYIAIKPNVLTASIIHQPSASKIDHC